MRQIFALAKKELNSYFGSPMALIFVGVFLAATLFTFFWVDTFFARGLADVRPMFGWMPILLIFLVAALTMRQWSEEERTGTLEILLTMPTRTVQLVLGKFLGVLGLVAVALGLTLFIPLSVSLLGHLDWGPVVGGYLAALLLAAAYAAIGLFVSSRTDNQIVALILTVLIGGLFYMVGAASVAGFAAGPVAEILRAIGTGSHFASIERGVVDLRDLVYYLSLTVMFLAFNVVSLNSKRWSHGPQSQGYRRNMTLAAALIALNLVVLNIWLYPVSLARADLTAQREYSLSPATTDLLSNLPEPLLIRGYFSQKSHPLLAPLVPQIRDMLEEYKIASGGKVTLEIIDPLQNPELEAEANRTYGIQPTPLQAADRYGASVVNAYFDILIRYGDQSQVLNFRDLIEVQPSATGQPEVRLRNLEYDLTRAIKKSVFGFQNLDSILAGLANPATLTLYVTPSTLPDWLAEAPQTIAKVAADIEKQANGKFSFKTINLEDSASGVTPQQLHDQYGLSPIPLDLFSSQGYYLHMVLDTGADKPQLLYPSGDFSEADIRTTLEAALKRSSAGFLKVVGLWTPPDTPTPNAFGQAQPGLKQYTAIADVLRQEYTVKPVDLSTGQVPGDVDVLLVVAPQNMTDADRFAIDQYLMRGGAVVVAAGNYALNPDQMTGQLSISPIADGLREMLAQYGLSVEQSLVMDPQNEPFPVPVTRNLGGVQVQEIQALNYPFFVDIRQNGMDAKSPMLANLPAVTLNWVSPITVDTAKNANRQVTTLLQSSPQAWLRTDTNIQPDQQQYPDLGFPVEGEQKSYPLAVSVQGVFESAFKGKPSPLTAQPTPQAGVDETNPTAAPTPAPNSIGVIESSPETARLVVIGSAEFLNDIVFNISQSLTRDRYLNSLQLAQNMVDWSVEDLDLLTIRSRGATTRLLNPLTESEQSFWEAANYVVALLAVLGLGILWRVRRQNEKPIELDPPQAKAEQDRREAPGTV